VSEKTASRFRSLLISFSWSFISLSLPASEFTLVIVRNPVIPTDEISTTHHSGKPVTAIRDLRINHPASFNRAGNAPRLSSAILQWPDYAVSARPDGHAVKQLSV
jgi:hypothetical protein